MGRNLKFAVFSLIAIQAIHSAEEYIYGFYKVFPIFKFYKETLQI
ncbi:MAG: hypothetical protein ACE5HW_07555 [Candidatus Methanofastidiosia archaeon]